MYLSLVTNLALAFFLVGCQKQTEPAPKERQEAVIATSTPAPPKPAVAQTYDGPFGLKMGLSKDQIEAMGIHFSIGEDGYLNTDKLQEPHSDFRGYSLLIGEKEGLCRLFAFGKEIDAGAFGTELLAKFDSLEKQLQDIYGKSFRNDFLRVGSMWNEPQYWMMGLLKKDRTLTALWTAQAGSALKEGIESVALSAMAWNGSSGNVILVYEFSNFAACKKSIDEKIKAKL